MPGDIIDASDGTLQSRIISPKEVYDGRETYLRSYARKKRPLISDFLSRLPAEPRTGALFKSELARILRSSHKFIGLIQGLVQFQLLGVENGDIVLDCRPGVPPDVRDYGGEAVNYRFTLDHRYVHHILQSRFINFESVLLSMRFKAWRNPDIFNEALFSLLVNFDRQRLQQAEHELQSVLDANDEFFEVVHDGEYYRVQRYCPHMGSDLSAVGQFGGGTITCMRHGWQFRLSDGACLNVAVPPLRVRRLENRSSHCS
jgi:nitrite reductase/ring-hydroxylating ferredoxin subunit